MKWEKGQSGNRKGRPRLRLFDDHLREKLGKQRGSVAKELVEQLVSQAVRGNVPALKLICERVGGKPRSAEVAAPNGETLSLDQVRTKLAELLSRPEVRKSLESLLNNSEPKVQTDMTQ